MTATRKSLSLAAAAAALLAAGVGTAVTASAQVAPYQCVGINSCKGQSACKQASHSCKGMNSCKGQGWLPTATKGECLLQGGHIDS
ncbi:MAG: hypothetical protein U1E53_11140 [Dongiaceae bacterium]